MTPRVGLGFDIHPFSDDAGRPLVLGGVTRRRAGPGRPQRRRCRRPRRSADALLGAAGLGDIGTHFPDDDPAYAGADSMELLARVVRSVSGRWEVGNVDVTVVLEAPKLAPYRHGHGAPADRRRRRSGERQGQAGRGPRGARPAGRHRLLGRGPR